ncbi:response regulator [Aneurinibacillus migulanus]|uniref:Histidine kinase n=1 Tax=Aneurinibacillus migulanus TaxID=47500 RepID=A0A0D1XPI5_ANEMI|nr:response regulator [Aneurinibacillus migulanus]KIV54108.1 histidine kinase [Aneurinibacillus migulanus]KON97619.1 histidine kinase [Aneurinibacillus migulanus]MED0895415.1 response regulator [Aneurinibacillus migulanus]MED1619677.1 response regulator [Aneurinibacillus migulanus]SDJ37762.1 Two-component response regulator, SAPR family, consists of REC, wHTH and BTAD domains [Aneurinibacillus migulanus]
MRVILVDDERLALQQLRKALECDVSGIQVIGMFSDPAHVVEDIKKLQPDAVFLDIHMPEISGLKLGEQLQELVPSIEIVFVTAYDRYAVQAFEMYALDYVMKPIQSSRLQKTVQRLREKIETGEDNKQELEPPFICCFNQLRFQLPGEEAQTVKWRTSKAQELFTYLLHHRERVIDRNTLIELLWPDFEMDRAAKQLYTTAYHIRQTLKSNRMEAVSISSGDLEAGYRLTVGEVRIDTEEWENKVKQLGPIDLHNVAQHEQALKLYKGDYLGDYEYMWAEQERERLRLLWLRHAQDLSQFYMEQGRWQGVIKVNQRIQQLLPDNEESYFTLMQLYDSLGYRGRMEEQYWLLISRLEQEMGVTVSANIRAWYENKKPLHC